MTHKAALAACAFILAFLAAASPADAQRNKGRQPPPPPPAPTHPNVALCVGGAIIEAKINNNWTWDTVQVWDPPIMANGGCRVRDVTNRDDKLVTFDGLRPLTEEKRAELEATARFVASAPEYVLNARRTYQGANLNSRCSVAAAYGLVGGPDMARDLMRGCSYNAQWWVDAAKIGPLTYDFSRIANAAFNNAANQATANATQAAVREDREARERAAAAEKKVEYSGGLGLNTGPTNAQLGNLGTGGGGGSPSEVQTRKDMATAACIGNASLC